MIGYSGPLTGNGASAGQDYLNGIQLYVDKLNAAGGINGQQVEIMSEDDQMDPKNSTTVAQKLVDAKVVAVLGPVTSGTAIPTLKIYGDAVIPQLTPASNPDVTAQGVKSVFRVDPDDLAQGGNIGRYSYDTLKAKTAAVINDKQAFGQGVSEQFQTAFEAAGGKTTSVNGITTGDVDFRAVLTKIKSENPDMVYFGGVAAEGGLIAKQMREAGHDADPLRARPVLRPRVHQDRRHWRRGRVHQLPGPAARQHAGTQGLHRRVQGQVRRRALRGPVRLRVDAAGRGGHQDGGRGDRPGHHRRPPRATPIRPSSATTPSRANGALAGGGTIYIYQVKDGKDVYVGESVAQ